jgi:hypothetical protein
MKKSYKFLFLGIGIFLLINLIFLASLVSAGEIPAEEIPAEEIPAEEIPAEIDENIFLYGENYSLMSFEGGNSFRFMITSQEIHGGSDLEDFPIYYNLANSPVEFWENVKENGGDIVITDENDNRLPLEIVFISTSTMTGEIYFAGDLLASSSSYYINYGNSEGVQPAEDEEYGKEDVWNSSYKGVWHFQESASNSAENYKDSTGNNVDGTGYNLVASSSSFGKIGNSLWTSGGSGSSVMRVIFPGNTSLNFSPNLTISSWIKRKETNEIGNWYLGKNEDWDLRGIGFKHGTLQSWWNRYSGDEDIESTYTLSNNIWGHLVETIDTSDNLYFYKDGQFSDSDTLDDPVGGASSLTVGASNPSNWEAFAGNIDELRISNDLKSSAWIKAEYLNTYNNSTFFTGGEQEEQQEEEATTTPPMLYLDGATEDTFLFISLFSLLALIVYLIIKLTKIFLLSFHGE